MRNSESYRLANNFEKSSHLFRCRLSKGTAECWAIWKSGRDCLSFLVLFELTGKSPARCTRGNSELPALATRRTASDPGAPCLALCRLEGWWIAINVRDHKQGVISDGLGVQLTHLRMHWTMEREKAKPDRGSRSLAVGGCGKAHPQTGKGRVL